MYANPMYTNPSVVASATLTKVNDDMVWSTIFESGWEMTSHLLGFKQRPILLPSVLLLNEEIKVA